MACQLRQRAVNVSGTLQDVWLLLSAPARGWRPKNGWGLHARQMLAVACLREPPRVGEEKGLALSPAKVLAAPGQRRGLSLERRRKAGGAVSTPVGSGLTRLVRAAYCGDTRGHGPPVELDASTDGLAHVSLSSRHLMARHGMRHFATPPNTDRERKGTAGTKKRS